MNRGDKMSISSLITIITVVLNDSDGLEKTIRSVVKQDYPNLEFIIIDACSEDQTLEIIKKYEDHIDFWISEKDDGIYDAINKGIDLAKGEWINFMNAGDTFYNSSVLSKIFEGNNYYGVDILYGVTIVKCELGFYPKKACDRISIITKKMPFCHQSAFVRSEIYKRFKFDISFLIKADFDFFIKCYLNNLKFQHLESYVTIYEGKGISSTHPIKSRKEAFRSVIKNNLPFKIKLYHFSKILEAFGKEIFKKILRYFYQIINMSF